MRTLKVERPSMGCAARLFRRERHLSVVQDPQGMMPKIRARCGTHKNWHIVHALC